MTKRKAMTIVMDGYIKWARLRPSDMDTKFVPEGQYNMEFYPETEEELDKLLNEAKERKKTIKLKDPYDGEGYGVGKWVKISRNHVNRSVEEFGGPPVVVKMDDDQQAGSWDFDEDGLIGNGTKARVKIVFYGEGNLAGHRLEKLGVLEHVPYESGAGSASGF
jgi:hypothetical protein